MTRAQAIETMARGMDPFVWEADGMGEPAREHCREKAARALAALEQAGAVIVPPTMTEEMERAFKEYALPTGYLAEGYAAMLAASPYKVCP